MDERELSRRIKALGKAVSSNEPTSAIIAIMDNLKKDAAPTEEMLRATKAGVFVGKLRSNADKDIARLASEIVTKWRKGVDAQKAKKAAQRAKLASPSSTPASTASPAPPSTSSNKPYEGDTEKRHFKEDKVDINRTGSTIRDNCIGMIYNGLAYRATDSIEDVLLRSIEVENAAYRAYKGDGQDYRSKMRSLFISLKNKTNRQLGRKVMSGDIAPEHFVIMSTKELASEEQRAKDEALKKENMKKAQVPMAEKSISDALKCGKCGQKKVSYSQAQTRSADEPMTTFCECTVCGNRWKFS
ncbi:transcription elongation factor S-II [Phialemonium atrogriseum]|uniref:Transcription elongation factor n=1 Tax=Phialemonium atrogriseum TaxID=1093897 RepID=A0AAJ0BV48_9PEZI|nr:transcription elongation factor S-II [Phialemonium atrogriseum]KAK1764875.1 transcription elongation factor S-II [Phialemonium atrogriseum]